MQVKVRVTQVRREINYKGDFCKEIVSIAACYGEESGPDNFRLIISNPEDFGGFLPGHDYIMTFTGDDT